MKTEKGKGWMYDAMKNGICEVIEVEKDRLVRREYPTFVAAKEAHPWVAASSPMRGSKNGKDIFRFESGAAHRLISR